MNISIPVSNMGVVMALTNLIWEGSILNLKSYIHIVYSFVSSVYVNILRVGFKDYNQITKMHLLVYV